MFKHLSEYFFVNSFFCNDIKCYRCYNHSYCDPSAKGDLLRIYNRFKQDQSKAYTVFLSGFLPIVDTVATTRKGNGIKCCDARQ